MEVYEIIQIRQYFIRYVNKTKSVEMLKIRWIEASGDKELDVGETWERNERIIQKMRGEKKKRARFDSNKGGKSERMIVHWPHWPFITSPLPSLTPLLCLRRLR